MFIAIPSWNFHFFSVSHSAEICFLNTMFTFCFLLLAHAGLCLYNCVGCFSLLQHRDYQFTNHLPKVESSHGCLTSEDVFRMTWKINFELFRTLTPWYIKAKVFLYADVPWVGKRKEGCGSQQKLFRPALAASEKLTWNGDMIYANYSDCLYFGFFTRFVLLPFLTRVSHLRCFTAEKQERRTFNAA